MNDPVRTVEIDRITLTGLEATPECAEHIRTHVEAELRRLLQREGLPRGLAAGQVSRIRASEMHLAEPHNAGSVAGALAGSIYHAIRSAGSSGGT